ncbi:hypothetical protein B0I75DRAFT_173297 [Yarrowia lipolytica]|nr:hypothetical protein B0I74DRAFT_151495 [Yarrowia lipolytica]RDW53355.1 hypothetical protein B0I75DRAFT_173297 [Yarrowia lipolytica]
MCRFIWTWEGTSCLLWSNHITNLAAEGSAVLDRWRENGEFCRNYPSLLGIKWVSIRNNKIVRMYGYTDDLRFSQVFLLHTNFEVSIEASSAKNQLLDELWNSDAVLFVSARDQDRFY